MNNQNSANDFETLQNAIRDLIGELQAIVKYNYHLHSPNNKIATTKLDSIRPRNAPLGELLWRGIGIRCP